MPTGSGQHARRRAAGVARPQRGRDELESNRLELAGRQQQHSHARRPVPSPRRTQRRLSIQAVGRGGRPATQRRSTSVPASGPVSNCRFRRLGWNSYGTEGAQPVANVSVGAAGVSYAYISRIEAGVREPSVKALRKLAEKLGVSVEQLETGKPTAVELAVENAGLEYGSLTTKERRAIETAAGEAAREGARKAALETLEQRRKAEIRRLQSRLNELGV